MSQVRREENLLLAAQCDDTVAATITTHERCNHDADFRAENEMKGTCDNAVSDLEEGVKATKNLQRLKALLEQ